MARYYRKIIPTRAIENSCFAALTDQVGRAGYVDDYPSDSPAQPHHPGAAIICDPSGEILAETQDERIEPEMIMATLEAAAINTERAKPNFALKTRRPELFGELVAEQVRW
jgi:predicted amidohydrolase